ncbi:hypothetical protein [Cellulomonas soli]|uniref:Indole-3-glycerol phosphate synthase n=1 Tax=Cellulomonas soli TaxID=931535 RepID=A0A512P9X9_9CELL|nr:hypothetical protein [Cellulomonas soli]NYI60490.1 hypothetical protein [Cellulomonas soli]GEP68005.1 hypothetical protein CSO01_07200 [Cellulomonas soli]
MTDTILVLAEDALSPADVEHLLALHPDEVLDYRVLVPADTERNLLVAIIDDLSLGGLREALDHALGKEPSTSQATTTAAEQVAASLAAFEAAGRTATGHAIDDDPLPVLRAAVAAGDIREIAVVTYPHAVEDTFHRDWASRAREELQVPVLHLYSGTSALG